MSHRGKGVNKRRAQRYVAKVRRAEIRPNEAKDDKTEKSPSGYLRDSSTQQSSSGPGFERQVPYGIEQRDLDPAMERCISEALQALTDDSKRELHASENQRTKEVPSSDGSIPTKCAEDIIRGQKEGSKAAALLQLCWWRELSDSEQLRIAETSTIDTFAQQVQTYMRKSREEKVSNVLTSISYEEQEKMEETILEAAQSGMSPRTPRECSGARRLHRQRMLLQAKEELREKHSDNQYQRDASKSSPEVDSTNVPTKDQSLKRSSPFVKKELPAITRDKSRIELHGLYRSAFRNRRTQLGHTKKVVTESPTKTSHGTKPGQQMLARELEDANVAIDIVGGMPVWKVLVLALFTILVIFVTTPLIFDKHMRTHKINQTEAACANSEWTIMME